VLVAESITGAPVVDDDGRVLGVISSADLLRAMAEEQDSGGNDTAYFEGLLEFSSSRGEGLSEDFQNRLEQIPASEAMTEGAISVSPDTPLAEIARTLRFQRIHRVLVVEDGVLEGIVTSFDLVGLLEEPDATSGVSTS
jgi:CBS domain-containing protein